MKKINLRFVHSFKQPFLFFHFVNAILTGNFFAVQAKVESILFILRDLVFPQRINPHFASAILSFWNFSVECQIFHWVIFCLHRESLYAGIWRKSLWNSP